jgi:hypothetical protein
VAQEQPAARKDLPQLLLVDLLLDKDAPAQEPALAVDQLPHFRRHSASPSNPQI